ncbi:tetratricopeptide repeat protein [Kineosporia babensis]|uniref:Replicase polyprotein 1ab n=1 Tax=Kineosporia babensis TaxID=499548 RepID=A0A9X1NCJ0_9ACTN|nr:hypothetical protein [Kineosporia babensis]MCD5312457.1 hypothetical protein [Kineosporia babensis]
MPVRKAAGRDPEIPEGISASMLDKTVRHELSGLSREVAVQTGAHLAAANYFIESDPELAWEHAVAARKRGSRLGVVRETAGLAAYRTGRYADALAELRTARRITGSNQHLPVMADCERGLGRPERALELARGEEAKTLDADSRIELKIVESGARADMGEFDAAVVVLQIPELESNRRSPSLARLRFAYSEALKQAKRSQEADTWRDRAIAEDPDGSAGVNDLDDDDLEVIDLEWDGDEDGEGAQSSLDDQEDGQEDDLDEDDDQDDEDEDRDARAADSADVDDLADQDDEDGQDDEDDEDDLDDAADAELTKQTDDDKAGSRVDGKVGEAQFTDAEPEGGKGTKPEGSKAEAASGTAFEMRFAHGAQEDAERSADRQD